MAYRLEFELPGLPKSMNARLHWRARHAENQKWTKLVHIATVGKRPRVPLERARLTLTRVSAVEPDYDNCVAAFKPVTDALVKCGILADDRMSVIGIPHVAWEKCAPKRGCVRVLVEDGNADSRPGKGSPLRLEGEGSP
jgi:hypothetical protein